MDFCRWVNIEGWCFNCCLPRHPVDGHQEENWTHCRLCGEPVWLWLFGTSWRSRIHTADYFWCFVYIFFVKVEDLIKNSCSWRHCCHCFSQCCGFPALQLSLELFHLDHLEFGVSVTTGHLVTVAENKNICLTPETVKNPFRKTFHRSKAQIPVTICFWSVKSCKTPYLPNYIYLDIYQSSYLWHYTLRTQWFPRVAINYFIRFKDVWNCSVGLFSFGC